MRLFLVASALPDPHQHATQMVLYETVRGIAAAGHEVTFQMFVAEGAAAPAGTREALATIDGLPGIRALEPLAAPGRRGARRGAAAAVATLRRAALTRPADLYPHVALTTEVARRVRAAGADAIVNVWSTEGLAATHGIAGVPKYAYYAMPEHLAPEARLTHPWLFDIPTRTPVDRARLWHGRLLNRRRAAMHFGMMSRYDALSNICAFHAALYASRGHPRSHYVQNMWPDVHGPRWRALREAQEGRHGPRVLGSFGNVFATGNTFGLHYLGAEVLPALRQRLREDEIQIHVYGRGRPYAAVANALDDPRVRMRGWVADIDAEIFASRVFLVMNNAGAYRGAHTRFLHAWALGACVVAHRANADAMPEIRHDENALLGDTPAAIADLVARALGDPALRRRIGEGGRRTFETHFHSAVVVPRLLEEIEACVEGCTGRAAMTPASTRS